MQQDRTLIYLIAAFIACSLIFTTFPQIDLQASGLFFDGATFPIENSVLFQALREVLWTLTLLVPICLLALSVAGLVLRPVRAAICLGPLVFMILGPGLLVNGLLKAHWGRARPADVAEFGGLAQFTPPLTITDQCLRNCSFVSGEAAGIVAVSLVVFYLLARPLPPSGRRALTLGLLALCIVGAGLRVAMGRHFLSDVLFAALFMAILFRLMLPAFHWIEARYAEGWCLLAKRPVPPPDKSSGQMRHR